MAMGSVVSRWGSLAMAVTIAGSIGWAATQRRPSQPRPSKANKAARAHTGEDLTVCAGADGVLRSADAGGCPPNLTRVKIDHAETPFSDCDDCNAWNPLAPDPKDDLDELARRIADLGKSSLLTVVDKKDRKSTRLNS